MQHVRRDPAARTLETRPLFEGEVRQQIINQNEQFRVGEVAFSAGGRTKWHTHTFHQVLVITEGRGIVATEDEERQVEVGDVLHIAPGTRHWHGGGPDTAMTHLSINGPGGTTW